MTKAVRSLEELAVSAEADEDLLLALINTNPILAGEPSDELAGDAHARAWLTAHVVDAPKGTDLALLRATRSALQHVIRGEAGREVLSDPLAAVRLRPAVGSDGLAWIQELPADSAVAARAVLAWGRLETAMPGRLRPCENSECSLFFVDRSRSNNGRWCSMAVCGNRMKARRHYARSRSEQTQA